MALPDWIRLIIARRGGRDANHQAAITQGVAESLQYGVTTVVDIATATIDQYEPVLDKIDLTLLHEVIGFSTMRAESSLVAADNRLREAPAQANVSVGLSPHAPYTVHPGLIEQLAERSARLRVPLAMHLAESPEELRLLNQGDGPFRDLLEQRSMWDSATIPRGTRPLDYLRQLARAHRVLVVHGNYLDEEELQFLADHHERMTLIYCPRTHAYFQHPPYPLERAIQRGVRVVLGTDSRASSPDLDLLAEVRFVADRHAGITPFDLLKMATVEAAQGLGRDAEVGTITPGKLANLAVVSLLEDAAGDPYELILDRASRVVKTWYRGQSVGPEV